MTETTTTPDRGAACGTCGETAARHIWGPERAMMSGAGCAAWTEGPAPSDPAGAAPATGGYAEAFARADIYRKADQADAAGEPAQAALLRRIAAEGDIYTGGFGDTDTRPDDDPEGGGGNTPPSDQADTDTDTDDRFADARRILDAAHPGNPDTAAWLDERRAERRTAERNRRERAAAAAAQAKADARSAAQAQAETFGYTITDDREFNSDNPDSPRHWTNEPSDRMLAIADGYATAECATAAAGAWLSDAWNAGRKFRSAETTIEIDSTAGMSAIADTGAARKSGRTHSAECGHCGDQSPTDTPPQADTDEMAQSADDTQGTADTDTEGGAPSDQSDSDRRLDHHLRRAQADGDQVPYSVGYTDAAAGRDWNGDRFGNRAGDYDRGYSVGLDDHPPADDTPAVVTEWSAPTSAADDGRCGNCGYPFRSGHRRDLDTGRVVCRNTPDDTDDQGDTADDDGYCAECGGCPECVDAPLDPNDDDDREYQAGYELGLTQCARPAECSDQFRTGYIDGRRVADEIDDPDYPVRERATTADLVDAAVRSALRLDDVSVALDNDRAHTQADTEGDTAAECSECDYPGACDRRADECDTEGDQSADATAGWSVRNGGRE